MRGREGVKDEVRGVVKRLKEELPNVLRTIRDFTDESRRYAYFIAWLGSRVEEVGLGKVVVTGGFAVELYTGRVYRTMDVDLICEGRSAEIIEEFLKEFSERLGRGYLPRIEELSLKSIDIVSTVYNRELPPVKVYINNFRLYIDPPEHLIVTYLAGWKHWGSTEDRDKALWLLVATKSIINQEVLRELAHKENVEDLLNKLIAKIRKLGLSK